jgi:hypothetical protein
MQHLFTYGPVPVTEREHVALQESEIGPLPAHWRVVRLGEVVEIHDKLRIPLSDKQRQSRKGIYPYCGANGVLDYIDDYLFEGEFVLLAEDGGYWGKFESSAYLMKGRFWVNNHAHILRAIEKYAINIFLLYMLNFMDISVFISGTTRGKLTQGVLKYLPIPLPPLDEQREIARMLQAVDAKIAAEQARCAGGGFRDSFASAHDRKGPRQGLAPSRVGADAMSIGAERTAVQNPFLRYAQEAGWTYLPPDEATRLRRGETGLVLHEVLVRQLQAFNPGVVDLPRAEDIAGRLVRVRPNIEGNLEAWEFLKGLKTVFVPEEKRERNVRLMDPVRVEANSFHVTDELPFQSGTRRIRLDLVFFVNGIPVIVVETKASRRLDGMIRALEQIRRYHADGPELMAMVQLYALTHLVQFLYAATWSLSPKDLFNWRDEQAGDFETLVKTFIAPSSPPDAGRGAGARASAGPAQAPGTCLAHAGLRQDLHDDHRRPPPDSGPGVRKPHGPHARGPQRTGAAALHQP